MIDTNVVSELRRRKPHGAVLAWLRTTADSDLNLSAVTIGEIQAGIEIARDQDPLKAAEIEAWRDRVVESFSVLAVDAAAFRLSARLMRGRSDVARPHCRDPERARPCRHGRPDVEPVRH
ncbi:MAG: PIN domain-containing protein [Dongiaceae bacterium]